MEPASPPWSAECVVIDVGVGTTDVVAYTGDPEYSARLVLPSRTSVLARRLRRLRGSPPEALGLVGRPMGGGPFTRELRRLMESGTRVYAELPAALTLSNDVEELRRMEGLELVEGREGLPDGVRTIETYDFRARRLLGFLEGEGVELEDLRWVAACVQDHGYHPDYESNRRHRFERLFRRYLGEGGCRPEEMVFRERPPRSFPRLRAAYEELERIGVEPLVMDSKLPVAMLGRVESEAERLLVIDYGTGHVTAFLFEDERVVGVYEHHSRKLDRSRFEEQVRAFVEGRLSDEEVYRDGGHGCCNVAPMGWDEVEEVIGMGPRRSEFGLGREPRGVPDRMIPAYGPAMYLTGAAGR
ncbi:MAG: DUF1786 family protein [Methanopyraceae archaeon]